MQPPATQARWPWIFFLVLCAALYLLGLGSAYAPTNGDEMVYIHIARRTAESGHWLPLVSDIANLRNTKPPLLFWQAMIAGDWGQNWNLFALRFPSIVYTFASAWMIATITRFWTRDANKGLLAAALFLLFFCNFRYGRVYLTSAAETFLFSLPIYALLWQMLKSDVASAMDAKPFHKIWIAVLAAGLCFGLGIAYKSFALIAPASATLWLALLMREQKLHARLIIGHSFTVGVVSLIALGLFGLWFLLDPNPQSVWNEFVIGENAGKMSGSMGYWQAALHGEYPMWTQLLAYPVNAGLLAFLVLGFFWFTLVSLFKRLSGIPTETSPPPSPPPPPNIAPILWMWLLVWLVIFTIPSQRSERYVIPAIPALAMLLAMHWEKIARIWFWLSLLIIAIPLLIIARVAWVMGGLAMAQSGDVVLTLFIAASGILAAIAGFAKPNWLRNSVLFSCLCLYAGFSAMVHPLDRPEANYSDSVQNQASNWRIAVPNGFTGQYERFHFLLPASHLIPYDAEGRNTNTLHPEMPAAQRLEYLLDNFDAVVWYQQSPEETGPSCLPGCKILGTRWHILSRHKSGEVTLANVWYPEQWLFRHEWLLERKK